MFNTLSHIFFRSGEGETTIEGCDVEAEKTEKKKTKREKAAPDPNQKQVSTTSIKFLNFRTQENFAVIYQKNKKRGQTLGYFIKKKQMK